MDCANRGLRLANIYNQSEQEMLNAAITAAGGLNLAFWLGTRVKNGIFEILPKNGWQKQSLQKPQFALSIHQVNSFFCYFQI